MCAIRLLARSLALAAVAAACLSVTQAQPACSWDQSIGQPGMNHDVFVLHEHEGTMYAGGRFTLAGGVSAHGVAMWTGAEWLPLGEGIGGVANPTVYALATFDDGDGSALYAGGAFTTAGGDTAHRIARWDGEQWTALGEGLGNNVRALTVFDDGSGPALYAGGTFQQAGGESIVGIARWDGEEWSALGKGLGGGLPYVYALTVFDDGSGPALYAGGTFITAGGEPATNIARWDGQEWSDVGGGVNQWVTALTVFDDGEGEALYAGGAFTSAGGTPAGRVARWDGEEWSALGSGVSGDWPWVEALQGYISLDGPQLHVGGWFELAGGQEANRVARWDGDAWHPLTQGLNERVWDLLTFDDGDGPALYVAGHFTQAGGSSAARIARWACKTDIASEAGPTAGDLRVIAYPNPASSEVTISFKTASAGPVRVAVYDLLGREVAVVAQQEQAAGPHDLIWPIGGLAVGTYVIRLETPDGRASQRFVVVRR